MYQQLWGYKVEEKLYLGVREQKRLNTTALDFDTRWWCAAGYIVSPFLPKERESPVPDKDAAR
jgi:hypothetical protein